MPVLVGPAADFFKVAGRGSKICAPGRHLQNMSRGWLQLEGNGSPTCIPVPAQHGTTEEAKLRTSRQDEDGQGPGNQCLFCGGYADELDPHGYCFNCKEGKCTVESYLSHSISCMFFSNLSSCS